MIPYSRPKRSDLYTLSWSKILFTAAHSHIAHIWQAVPPPPRASLSSGCLSSLFLWSRNFATMGTQWRLTSPTLGTRGVFSRATRSFVGHRPTRLRPKTEDTCDEAKKAKIFRAGHFLRLDRNRKPRMKSLWHPGNTSPLYWYKTYQQTNDLDRKGLFFFNSCCLF